MDFDKPKVYGDTSITDGLVSVDIAIVLGTVWFYRFILSKTTQKFLPQIWGSDQRVSTHLNRKNINVLLGLSLPCDSFLPNPNMASSSIKRRFFVIVIDFKREASSVLSKWKVFWKEM